MNEIDKIIHQPVRLKIVAALDSLPEDEQVDFTAIAKLHGLTDGNLGAHLAKLEGAGYIRIDKSFLENKKPRTQVSLTAVGRRAFAAHVAALQTILQVGDQQGDLGSKFSRASPSAPE